MAQLPEQGGIIVRDEDAPAPPPYVLVDALPYLDNDYDDPEVKAVVHGLIESEMSMMPRKDYLAHLPLPPVPSPWMTTLMESELSRVGSQEQMAPLDLSRYEVQKPPKELLRDPQAWRQAVSNAKAQLEHQHNRLVNLELLQQFGAQAWLQQNKALEAMAAGVERQAAGAAKAADATNLKRKHSQEQAGPRMGSLQFDVHKTVDENQQLSTACALLRRDTKRLKAAVIERGLKTEAELGAMFTAAEDHKAHAAPEWKDKLDDAMDEGA